MDIKSKKCKVITAWVAFFLSICLLMESGLTGLNLLAGNNLRGVSVKDAFTSDFEETEEFRSFVSDYLDIFLSMAAGGPVNWYGRYGDVVTGDSEDIFWGSGTTESTMASVAEESAEAIWDGNDISDEWDYKTSAKQVHETIKK